MLSYNVLAADTFRDLVTLTFNLLTLVSRNRLCTLAAMTAAPFRGLFVCYRHIDMQTKKLRHFDNGGAQGYNAQNAGHLFDVKLEYFFHVHRDADKNRVVAPVVARMGGNDCPDRTRTKYRQPRYFSVLCRKSSSSSTVKR